MQLTFFTPSCGVCDNFGAATFGFVGAEDETAKNLINFPHDINGKVITGTYEECLMAAIPGDYSAGIVLIGNAGNENEFIHALQNKLNIPLVGGSAAIDPQTGEDKLITNRGDAALFLISDDRYSVKVECENIHKDILGEYDISYSEPRIIDFIDGVDAALWFSEKRKELNIPDDDFEQLTLSDMNNINAHLSYVDGKLCSGRDLATRMLLRYVPKENVAERMRSFYNDKNAIVFGCAGLKKILKERLNTDSVGLFMFGEICTSGDISEFGNLMLSKLVLKRIK